jgi:hypothetical protein
MAAATTTTTKAKSASKAGANGNAAKQKAQMHRRSRTGLSPPSGMAPCQTWKLTMAVVKDATPAG